MRARLEGALHAAWRRKGAFSLVMWPLSRLYGNIVASRRARFERQPGRVQHDSVPVAVVGNIYVGGTGKTPVVIALVAALQARGWHPGVISRGYGAVQDDKPRVGQGCLDPALFGDEPALIAAETGAPVCVHPDRPAALRRLRRQHPDVDVVVSDDGLQHLAMGRDLEIVVQDGRGVGNGQLLPAGPLREPASRLESVDFVINNLSPGEPQPVTATLARTVNMSMEPGTVEHLVTGERLDWPTWLDQHRTMPCAAAAAIGRPERFFNMLARHGVQPSTTLGLPDHYDYQHSPFDQLIEPHILITPKDAVKCRKFNDERLYCIHPAARFSDDSWLDMADDMLRAISLRKRAAARAEALHSEV